jgi:hypothetical protein
MDTQDTREGAVLTLSVVQRQTHRAANDLESSCRAALRYRGQSSSQEQSLGARAHAECCRLQPSLLRAADLVVQQAFA